ncbi:unnamed protein product [Prorocentrum cordatum]|uniref:Uncharacterized protein n=1 Tax=Prorocentrum cordatum TaxID=2364126 RepID=A0ABN9UJK4_9DINO|nr:unnamed protein product [Polarella glacialis]
MAQSEFARPLMPPGSLNHGRAPVQAAQGPQALLQAFFDDIEDEEMALAEALAAELFPDEDEDKSLARHLKKPPAAVDTKPAREQFPPPSPQVAQLRGGPRCPRAHLGGQEGAGASRRRDGGAEPARGAVRAGVYRGSDSGSAFDVAGVPADDSQMLDMLEGMATADAVLKVAGEHLPRLTTEMAAEALYLAARRLPSAQHGIAQNPHLPPLLLKLSAGMSELQRAGSLAQLAWTLGKLDTRVHAKSPPLLLPGMEECMLQVCGMLPELMDKCSAQDLTNTLWGVARLFPGGASGTQGHWPQVSLLSHAIVSLCVQRVAVLPAQSTAIVFWAMARLKAHGPDVEEFVRLALEQTSSAAQLEHFSPQGLANVLWALAKLRLADVGRGPQDDGVRRALIAMADACAGRLLEFDEQELSMVAWSCAKLYEFKQGEVACPAKRGRAWPRPAPVDQMLLKLASAATDRIARFEDQGISNIAWALATLELTGAAPALAPGRGFIEAAMSHCATELEGYSAQAMANLIWACTRMDSSQPCRTSRSTRARFCSAVAEEMMTRMTRDRHSAHMNATWRDLAGIAVALSHCRQRSQSVTNFMSHLTHKAANWVSRGDPTSQEVLNIAQSAIRMRVPPEDMLSLVCAIEACIVTRGLRLNDVDRRQWWEVQQWCPPSRKGPMFAVRSRR